MSRHARLTNGAPYQRALRKPTVSVEIEGIRLAETVNGPANSPLFHPPPRMRTLGSKNPASPPIHIRVVAEQGPTTNRELIPVSYKLPQIAHHVVQTRVGHAVPERARTDGRDGVYVAVEPGTPLGGYLPLGICRKTLAELASAACAWNQVMCLDGVTPRTERA